MSDTVVVKKKKKKIVAFCVRSEVTIVTWDVI